MFFRVTSKKAEFVSEEICRLFGEKDNFISLQVFPDRNSWKDQLQLDWGVGEIGDELEFADKIWSHSDQQKSTAEGNYKKNNMLQDALITFLIL